MTFISYAQNFEDVMLWRALKHVEKGFYVDVGANDPVLHSVTKAFYDRGWRGINVEPVETWIDKLKKERPEDTNLQIVASNNTGDLCFFEVVGTGLSTIQYALAKDHAKKYGYEIRKFNVQTKPLDSILAEHSVGEIHFLKIDVEGSELFVLQGLNLSHTRPWIILVESTLPLLQTENYDTWESLIKKNGYHYAYFDGLNRFYIADEHSDLDSAFETPPNIWDDFHTLKEYTLINEGQQLTDKLQYLTTQLRSKEEEQQHLIAQIQKLEADISSLLNSYSMRITVPLRMASGLVRASKKWAKQQLGQTLSKVKRLLKGAIGKTITAINTHPELKQLLLRLLNRLPILKQYLRKTISSSSIFANSASQHTLSEHNLSSRQAEILKNLRERISEHQR